MKPRIRPRFGKHLKVQSPQKQGGLHFPHLLQELRFIVFRASLQPTQKVEYISENIFDVTGFSPQELTSDPGLFERIIHPEDLFWLRALFFNEQPATSDPITLRIFCKNGALIWMEISLKPVLDAAGSPVALEGIAQEVTRRKVADLEMEESRILVSSIIGTALDAMIVLDSDFKIRLFNVAAEEMFQVTMNDVLGDTLDRFLPGNIARWHEEQIRRFGENHEMRHIMGLNRTTSAVRANGQEFPVETSLSVFEIAGKKYYTAILRDITERKRVENELRHLSTHDTLTGLYNRLFFEEEMRRLDQGRTFPVSIVIADVDRLKYVNDNYGHHRGDELLKLLAQAVRNAFRVEDVVARIGGDEFGILLPNADAEITSSAIERIYNRIQAIALENPEFPYGISIGFATSRPKESLADTERRADANMYRHKNSKAHRRTTG